MAIVQAHVAAVQELYVAYFGRPADSAGLDYWTNVVQAQNGSTAAVSASFAKQPEYIVAYYNLTSTQIVDKIYLNMFGRGASTTDGRSYWVDLLASGKVTIDVIVAEVANGARGTDAEAVENKVAAATAFTATLDTPAENAGYAGESALILAKAFITGVTTDATLTNAIAPAALANTVAAVVKAGTPFSLESAIATSADANEALTDFLADNDLDALTGGATPAGELADAVDAAAADIEAFTFGTGANAVTLPNFENARPAVQAALLEEAEAGLSEALGDAEGALATARAAASAGVRAIVDNKVAATADAAAAATAATNALRAQNAAEASVEQLKGSGTVTVNYKVVGGVTTTEVATVTYTSTGGTTTTLINENTAGDLKLASSAITERAYPGITALLNAVKTNEDAQLDKIAADAALSDATTERSGLTGADATAATAIETNTTAVSDAEEAIEELADLVEAWEDAVALEAEYVALAGAVTDANDAFDANGYVAPVPLNSASAASTSGSDIFLLGDEDAVTITGFGRSGDDVLFVGSGFTLGTDIDEGNNAVMEVFFVQNGTRTEVHIEQAAYGSDSDDVTIITLVGVDADDLAFSNGIITMK